MIRRSHPPSYLRRARPSWLGGLAVVCVVALLGGTGPGASATGDGADSDEIDVLTATREEVRLALAELEDRYAAQKAKVDDARRAAQAADAAVARARAKVALAEHEVELARETVARYAVEAYIRPPAQDALRVLSLAQADDAGYANNVIRILAEQRQQVVEILVDKQEAAARERAAADRAAERAREAQSRAEMDLVELDRVRAAQRELAVSLDERLDHALAEAAALAEIDRQIAAELAAQELDLRDSGPASPPSVVLTGGPVDTAPPPTAPPPAPPSTRPPSGGTPTTRPPSAPTTTRPPTTTPPPPGVVTWADVTSVSGIWVHKSIAQNVRNLLNAATAAGLNLGGGGYRDPAAQIATRRANCGPTYYDIYEKPSNQCHPPTARPGRSMHERGLAIDFTSSGSLITSRSNPAFVWLRANAARFGLYNLPSEPWHWSTNGN